MEFLSYDIIEQILNYISDIDLFHLCETDKNISRYCNQALFWAYRASAKGYIKNTDEFGNKEVWPKGKANERYLQLSSEEDCIPGSEIYDVYWKYNFLYTAGKKGDIKIITYFLNKGGDINTALYGAALKGHIHIVKYLISRKNYYIDYVIQGAIKGRHIEIVKYLIDLKRDININRAFVIASEVGDIDIVKYLIKKGATDLNGALKYASEKDVLEYLERLINEREFIIYN